MVDQNSALHGVRLAHVATVAWNFDTQFNAQIKAIISSGAEV